MPVTVEVLRDFGKWEQVDLGPEPFVIKSNLSNASTRYIIGQDEDGPGAIITIIAPSKDDTAKLISGLLGAGVGEISQGYLEKGQVFPPIEGVLPGHTKSEMIRLTQE